MDKISDLPQLCWDALRRLKVDFLKQSVRVLLAVHRASSLWLCIVHVPLSNPASVAVQRTVYWSPFPFVGELVSSTNCTNWRCLQSATNRDVCFRSFIGRIVCSDVVWKSHSSWNCLHANTSIERKVIATCVTNTLFLFAVTRIFSSTVRNASKTVQHDQQLSHLSSIWHSHNQINQLNHRNHSIHGSLASIDGDVLFIISKALRRNSSEIASVRRTEQSIDGSINT